MARNKPTNLYPVKDRAQANQVLVNIAKRNWSTNKDNSNVFGLEPNFGCCTANMHQGWPKFVESLWMASPEGGLAVVAYGPSVVTAKVEAISLGFTVLRDELQHEVIVPNSIMMNSTVIRVGRAVK